MQRITTTTILIHSPFEGGREGGKEGRREGWRKGEREERRETCSCFDSGSERFSME